MQPRYFSTIRHSGKPFLPGCHQKVYNTASIDDVAAAFLFAIISISINTETYDTIGNLICFESD